MIPKLLKIPYTLIVISFLLVLTGCIAISGGVRGFIDFFGEDPRISRLKDDIAELQQTIKRRNTTIEEQKQEIEDLEDMHELCGECSESTPGDPTRTIKQTQDIIRNVISSMIDLAITSSDEQIEIVLENRQIRELIISALTAPDEQIQGIIQEQMSRSITFRLLRVTEEQRRRLVRFSCDIVNDAEEDDLNDFIRDFKEEVCETPDNE